MGWHKWIGRKGIAIAIDRFGASAPIDDLARVYGFTKEAIVKRVLSE
jgi:transketolase